MASQPTLLGTDARARLAGPHLSVVSAEPDLDLQHIARTIGCCATVDGHAEFEALLRGLVVEVEHSEAATGRTLDLIGHTRTDAALLTLGDWVIDGADPATTAVFHGLADREVLPRLGVHALRLLGCRSAATAQARDTMCRLADLLGIEVWGANQLLHAGHYEPGGFRDCWSFLLVAASELRERSGPAAAAPVADACPRVLDLAALPTVTLDTHSAPYPRCVATEQDAQRILHLVRREGAPLLGPRITPDAEIALPSTRPGAYRIAHVVLQGAFLRFYPDGMSRTGILFPVDDADALRRVVAALRASAFTR